MSKKKIAPRTEKRAASETPDAPADPYAVLKHPAHPPRANVPLFLVFAFALITWIAYLIYVAMYG